MKPGIATTTKVARVVTFTLIHTTIPDYYCPGIYQNTLSRIVQAGHPHHHHPPQDYLHPCHQPGQELSSAWCSQPCVSRPRLFAPHTLKKCKSQFQLAIKFSQIELR